MPIFSWAGVLRDVCYRCLCLGLRLRSAHSRWRGVRVEVALEVEGTPEAILAFARYLESMWRQESGTATSVR